MNRRETAFSIFHPSVPIVFFALWICFVMVCFHPVYLAISFMAAITLSFTYFGRRKTFASLTWQLPFVFLIALVNPLFSAQGSTEILKIGELAIYEESLLYGAFMGVMLVTMLVCFSCANKAISHEGFMSVCSKRFPTVTLMISMAARLVPSLKMKAAIINDVQKACTCANSDEQKPRRLNFRMFTVLMGWSMEDSLVMADSMKIAGWSNSRKRTTYILHKIKTRDILLLVFTVALFTLCCLFAYGDYSLFSFYPTITKIEFSFGYVDFAVFAFLPAILEVIDNV